MESTTNSNTPWSFAEKAAFRFFFVYFLIYIIPFPINIFGLPFSLDRKLDELMLKPVQWVGEHILNIPYEITTLPLGSGDTTFNYVQIFIYFSIALIATIIWTAADRNRINYEKLHFWLRLIIRYYLAYYLMVYGFAKIIKTQFSSPSAYRLLEPYGDSSPMGLLWTFMGYSVEYNFFTGIAEALGGFLMFFRRTTLLGALIAIAVMSNIVALNFFYDVPVKLFSSHLLIMCIFIAAPDTQRLINLFILNKTVPPADVSFLYKDKRIRIARIVIKTLLIGFLLYSNISSGLENQKQWGSKRPKPALEGIYEVENFVVNQDTLPPLATDSARWDKLAIEYVGRASIFHMAGNRSFYNFEPDTVAQQIVMYTTSNEEVKDTLYYEPRDSNHLLISGILQSDTLQVMLRRKSPEEFLLISRGFHWINETPFNR